MEDPAAAPGFRRRLVFIHRYSRVASRRQALPQPARLPEALQAIRAPKAGERAVRTAMQVAGHALPVALLEGYQAALCLQES